MSNMIPGNQKHLTLADRLYIEDSLNNNVSFKDIAKFLCKDPTTISKEVRLHRLDDIQPKRTFNNPHNFCTKRFRCKKTNVCNKIIICDTKCASWFANLLPRNNAPVWTNLLMFATVATNRSTVVPFRTSIFMMQSSHNVNMRNCAQPLETALTSHVTKHLK